MSNQAYRLGQQLGNYRLIRLLGRGGFADVYFGEHIYLNTFVAIKLLKDHLDQNEITHFLQEGRTLAHLIHPNIIRTLDYGVDSTTPYLVMDYAPNRSLEELYPRGTLVPLNSVVKYVNQVAQALQYAHNQGIIHRDVKPGNMLLDKDDNVLLSDFGISNFIYNDNSVNIATQTQIMGTIPYMAPELFEGKPRRASDQYALGIVVYQWLTGISAFNGTVQEIVWHHLNKLPTSLHEINVDIPRPVEGVVLKALSKNPIDRYKNISDFATALEQAAKHTSINVESTTAYTAKNIQLLDQTIDISHASPLDGPAALLRKVGKAILESLSPVAPNSSIPTQPPQEPPELLPTSDDQNICPFCGKATRPGDTFCSNCGASLLQNDSDAENIQTNPNIFKNEQDTIATRFVQRTSSSLDQTQASQNQTLDPYEEESFVAPLSPPLSNNYPLPVATIKMAEPTSSNTRVDENAIIQLIQEGEIYYRAKQYEEALNVFVRVVTLDPRNINAHGYKGNALGKLRRHKEALEAYTTALNIDSQHSSLWSAKGDILVKLRRLEDALSAYEEALKINLRDSLTWLAKASVLVRLKRYDQAIEAYKECLNINPNDASTWAVKGNVLAKLGCDEEALEAYDTALKFNKRDGAIWEAKGKLLSKLQRHEESLEVFKQATRLFPKKVEFWIARSDILATLERYEEATEDCKHAHLLKPEDHAIKQRYVLLQQLKQQKDAKVSSAARDTEMQNSYSHASTIRFASEGQMSNAAETKKNFRGDPVANVTREVSLYDVFLSHADEDSDLTFVEELANSLEDEHNLRVWLDIRMQIPGESKQQTIMQGLQTSRCYAICIGKHTPVAWFQRQMELALDQQTKKACRVIPVLLSNAPSDVDISDFLKQNMLVNFRDWEYGTHFMH